MIENELIVERIMRMGIEGRSIPFDGLWDEATSQLAKENKSRQKLCDQNYPTFEQYCEQSKHIGERILALRKMDGRFVVTWFNSPSEVKFIRWQSCGRLPLVQ